MKKKIVLVMIIAAVAICAFSLSACCDTDDDKEFSGGTASTVRNVKDLSVMFGKDYFYPPNDNLIYSIKLESLPLGKQYEVRYIDHATETSLFCIIGGIKTQIWLLKDKVDSSENSSKKETINELELSCDISMARVSFRYLNVRYYIFIDKISYEIADSYEFADSLTLEQKNEYVEAVKQYVLTFKLYE